MARPEQHSEEPSRERLAAASVGDPACVRLLADTIADAPFPMFIVVGPERRLLYNRAYEPILGPLHPSAQGRPFFNVWPEVREEIELVIDLAFVGEATRFEDLPVVLNRPNSEAAWFTFSYSPVRDEAGVIQAALCVCSEMTQVVGAKLSWRRWRRHFGRFRTRTPSLRRRRRC